MFKPVPILLTKFSVFSVSAEICLFHCLTHFSFTSPGNEQKEDDEPDKMAIAAQRIGRLKRFIIRVIKGFFCGIKGALCFIFRCGKARIRETDMDLDILADKEFQVSSRPKVDVTYVIPYEKS